MYQEPSFQAFCDADDVIKTDYSRATLQTKIVHLGFGAFHRAHQAVFTDLANQEADPSWGIFGINLFRKGPLTEQFCAQDNQAVLLEKAGQETTKRLVRSFTGAMNVEDQGIQAALAKLCEPAVAIVSLTVTEKGYCLTPEGRINRDNELIAADLKNPQAPRSAIGLIGEALRLRKTLKLPAFTVMSCDNIPENGGKTKAAVLEYAMLLDPELASWIEQEVTFPSTMVDRIVPAMSDASFDEIERETGVRDPFGLISESFKQWVVEDQFCSGRPNWHLAGVMMVNDVLPYEEMKLRMLNGSHSFLAYVGGLCGHDYIYQCMQDSLLKDITLALMINEQAPSLSSQLDVDLKQYAELLIARFSNQSIKHQTAQIAMDGSQKLPPRVIDSILTLVSKPCYESAQAPRILLLLLAGWMHFIQGKHRPDFQFIDPEAQTLNALLAVDDDKKCASLLQFKAVFSDAFIAHQDLVQQITHFYYAIDEQGIRAVLDGFVPLLRSPK
ncbi:mannitol dehydrogenase family protein [Marinomonas arenicola]|uniref:mannitol dehydrogenase family protein n=1 Tax=Marinomonas TaxID=28253 RepID=UPI0010548C21|nr:mannitol dehydrogenase family protein [Marinomonas sp. KMM3893]